MKAGQSTLLRELTVGGGHAGGQMGWVHFGLGEAGAAEIRVQWPGGEWGPWQRAEADHFAVIARGGAQPRYWAPGEGDPRESE